MYAKQRRRKGNESPFCAREAQKVEDIARLSKRRGVLKGEVLTVAILIERGGGGGEGGEKEFSMNTAEEEIRNPWKKGGGEIIHIRIRLNLTEWKKYSSAVQTRFTSGRVE